MSDETDITKKIKETKRQTQELKNQLQSLIDEGKSLVCPSQSKTNLLTSKHEEEPLRSPNKVQIIKSYENKHSKQKSENPNIPLKTVNIDSPRKSKNYDVQEAREYIKKQKEKRLEQYKNQNEAKFKAEIQKKKLQELHKKSLELLAKNVQARRERSKSRDRNMYVRPDDAGNLGANLRKAKSMDKINSFGVIKHKNPNLLYPPSPDFKSKGHSSKAGSPQKIVIIARNFTRQGVKNIENKRASANITIRDNSKINLDTENAQLDEVNKLEFENKTKDRISSKINTTKKNPIAESSDFEPLKPRKLFDTEDVVDNVQAGSSIKINPDSVKNILDYKSASSTHSNITLKSPDNVDLDKVQQKTNLIETPVEDKIVSLSKNKPTDNITKHSKEIQTETIRKEYPKWLEEQPPQAYPFNFINTITRKLQVATNRQKSTTDIGVQNSLLSTTPQKQVEIFPTNKSQENSKRDLRSFISHKGLNLDPGPIEHLELFTNKRFDAAKTLSSHRSTQVTETESESDTSKNIPEISSESGTSLQKNRESVRKTLQLDKNIIINTEKIDNMKLVPHSIAATTTIRSESQIPLESKLTKPVDKKNSNTLSVASPYASDFDSDVEVSEESLNRSRRSIISFNRSCYNKVLIPNPDISNNASPKNIERSQISPHKSVSSVNTEMLNSNHSSHSTTERSQISPHKSISSVNTDMLLNSNVKNASKSGINSKKNDSSDFSLQKNKLQNNLQTTDDMNHSVHLSNSMSIPSLSQSNQQLNTASDKLDRSITSTESAKSNNKISGVNESSVDNHNTGKRNLVTSSKNSSVRTEVRPSRSLSTNLSKSEHSFQNINTQRGSESFNRDEELAILPLTEPKLSLKHFGTVKTQAEDQCNHIIKNLSVRSGKVSTNGNGNDANQIHLKFEAEIHLLNDFNESLRKFSALEQAIESLKTNNTVTTSKILQNNNAKTSLTAKSSTTSTKISENVRSKNSQSQISQINFSRGSFVNTSVEDDLDLLANSALDKDNSSILSTGLDGSNLNSINQSLSVKSQDHLSNFENLQSVNFAGLSLNMFEQLIKDEDARLENLKTILKIREQALLDRTKGELAWLEIQRKHFKETGKLHEASVIKKKQRGILINHQKEKHEVQRLKQMQKAASIERKIVLKEQRNLIRQQLSTDNMLTKMKVNTPRERRLSGPLKVLQSHTESIRSETSITRRSSSEKEKDVLSITSHHSTTHHSIVSEMSEVDIPSKHVPSMEHQKYIKRTLLMREEALKKRRKAAEELLQWHKKLLEEEKRIAILESTASAIISQKPSISASQQKFDFRGKQLNQLWFNLTGSDVKKFVDDKVYPMSQLALERFCKSAREYSHQTKTLLKKSSENDLSVSDNIPEQKTSSEKDYVSDFENESIAPTEEIDVVVQSIDLLINNFNQVRDDISTLNITQSRKSDQSNTEDILSEKLDKTESEAEISVIETNKTKSEKIKDFSDSNKVTIDETIPEFEKSIQSVSILEKSLHLTHQEKEAKDSSEKIKTTSILEEPVSDTSKIITTSEKSSSENNVIDNLSVHDDIVSKLEKSKSITTNKSFIGKDQPPSEEFDNKNESSSQKSSDNKQTLDNIITAILSDESSSPKTSLELYNSKSLEDKIINSEEDIEEEINAVVDKIIPVTTETKESLNESQEILLILGESEVKTSSDDDGVEIQLRNTLTESEEILSKLNQVSINAEVQKPEDIVELNKKQENDTIKDVTESQSKSATEKDDKLNKVSSEVTASKTEGEDKSESDLTGSPIETSSSKPHEDIMSQSLLRLYQISKSDNLSVKGSGDISKFSDSEVLQDISVLEEIIKRQLEQDADEDLLKYVKETNDIHNDVAKTINNKTVNEIVTHLVSCEGDSVKKDLTERTVIPSEAVPSEEDIISKDIIERTVTPSEALPSEEDIISKDIIERTITPSEVISSEEGSTNKGTIERIVTPSEVITSEENKISDEQVPSNDPIEVEEVSNQLLKSVKIDDIENQDDLVPSVTEINIDLEESDDSKLALSDKSNESFIINDISDELSLKREDNSEEVEDLSKDLKSRDVSDKLAKVVEDNKTNKDSSIMEEVDDSSSLESSKPISNLSYGVIQKSLESEKEQSYSNDTEASFNKEEVCYEEKEHDSLSSATGGSSSDLSEQVLPVKDKRSKESDSKSSSEDVSEKSKSKKDSEDCRDIAINIKRRVSEILADSNLSRGDKSPRVQDLYVTAYDLISPAASPERAPSSPVEDSKLIISKFDSETQELLRKQLAVEEEIKAITKQQQKEHNLMYIREIPNKPPPPYTPPSSRIAPPVLTIIPTSQEIEEITMYSAKILHKAYSSNNLANVNISDKTLSLISKNISKDCYKFVFDLCKDIAREHYKQFEEDNSPSWLRIPKKVELTLVKPLDTEGLKLHMIKKLKELFGYQKPSRRETAIIKWSRKKRDHVDEILVMECQQEEAQWTNYQKDEQLVKDQITNEIFDSLLKDTADVYAKLFSKKIEVL